jgi:hypothetical protein
MSIYNLFKSWEALAPQEAMLVGSELTMVLLRIPEENSLAPYSCLHAKRTPEVAPYELNYFSKAIAMAWLTQCIEARGWGWSTGVYVGNHSSSGSSVWIDADTRVDIDGDRPVCALESLLTAYITAIACQRKISSSQDTAWVDYAGSPCKVLGVFPFGTKDVNDTAFCVEGNFSLEEDPNKIFPLLSWEDGYLEAQHLHLSEGYLAPRVFFSNHIGNIAASPESFLGLVGNQTYGTKCIQHDEEADPVDVGLLRFAEVIL